MRCMPRSGTSTIDAHHPPRLLTVEGTDRHVNHARRIGRKICTRAKRGKKRKKGKARKRRKRKEKKRKKTRIAIYECYNITVPAPVWVSRRRGPMPCVVELLSCPPETLGCARCKLASPFLPHLFSSPWMLRRLDRCDRMSE